MGKKYKVVYDIKDCIGAAVCHYADPETWEIRKPDGKATIKLPKTQKSENQEVVWVDESKLPKLMEAAKGCPVVVIHIYDEEGNKLI
ncbi:MAG: ferredoxin [Nanoarchaeota archaeon]